MFSYELVLQLVGLQQFSITIDYLSGVLTRLLKTSHFLVFGGLANNPKD